ncbi:glycosyltransferase family 4 protein [Azospirillum argentinense]|uniref:Glycosyltransferase n=1 Tax=Azospirillum brasilense TaxID=192 RepID=A0A4D8QAG6_AZOBR|nr:glycosyltransferase family 4 protein [Azospirillum argentinense]QCO07238.1 glycosyltransferase [Azospirillum argentinense]
MSNAAIFFHPDGYLTARKDLKGRHVAGESFLNGFFRHSGQPEFICHAASPEQARSFAELAGRLAPGSSTQLVPTTAPEGLARVGCLFVPGPGIDRFVWQRRRVGQRTYSLCGITHTTSESPEMFGQLLTAPVQPWDAVICTSLAARASVEAILHPYAAFLSERFGAVKMPMPQLPVIPLGIDTGAFRFDEAVRHEERKRLGIAPDDVAVLFVGRLSFHAKAHPIPMYMALQRTAERTGRRIHLIQAGWFSNDSVAAAFQQGARRYCPSVNAIFLDGRVPDVRTRIWAAADLFTSLSDNIQETFGITPLEAMAAGLPVVVADWNGYRETVRNGVDGFRIPTMLPPLGSGLDLAERYAIGVDTYDYYIGRASQMTSVDIDAAEDAFTRLTLDGALRRQMGEAARVRAGEFDWRVIIPRYQELWRELAAIRGQEVESAPWRGGNLPDGDARIGPNPVRPDPMSMFASYPTETLSGATRLVRTEGASMAMLTELLADPLNSTARGLLSPPAELALALDAFAPPLGRSVAEVAAQLPADHRLMFARSLVHLLKFGLLRMAPPPAA